MKEMAMNRRQFVTSTALGTVALSFTPQFLSAMQATPTPNESDPWVTGNAFDLLQEIEGEPDTLIPVVEPFLFAGSSYAVVLRSRYSERIILNDIYGTVRNAEGVLIATVETAYFAPAIIEPNALCIVGVELDSNLTQSEQRESSVDLDYQTEIDATRSAVTNLRVTDFSIRPERFIGVVENITAWDVNRGYVVGVLLHDDGELASWFLAATDKREIAAGDSSTFSNLTDWPSQALSNSHLIASWAIVR